MKKLVILATLVLIYLEQNKASSESKVLLSEQVTAQFEKRKKCLVGDFRLLIQDLEFCLDSDLQKKEIKAQIEGYKRNIEALENLKSEDC